MEKETVCLYVLINSYPIAKHSREKARALRNRDEIRDHAIKIAPGVI